MLFIKYKKKGIIYRALDTIIVGGLGFVGIMFVHTNALSLEVVLIGLAILSVLVPFLSGKLKSILLWGTTLLFLYLSYINSISLNSLLIIFGLMIGYILIKVVGKR